MRALLIPVGSLCLFAQTPDALQRIRARMAETLDHQPDYTCLETVDRTYQNRASGMLVQDTLRLEVALVNGKEMFAWPGSRQFEDRKIQELIPTGMFGNGNFATFARVVFASDAPEFESRGETTIERKPVVRYDFRVSRQRSEYTLRVGSREARVGFHGSFYADSASEEVRRLLVSADDIPPDLGLLSADDRVDYGNVRIGDGNFLLPVASELKMKLAVEDDQNVVRFTSCHHFEGQSVLRFDDPQLELGKAASVQPREVRLPGNSGLELELREDLDLTQAAVGDPVHAMLRRAVIGVPQGAVASGRILTLDRHAGFFLLKIEFEDLDWPGGHVGLSGVLDRVEPPAGVDQRGGSIGLADDAGDIVIVRAEINRLGGLVMFWKTEP